MPIVKTFLTDDDKKELEQDISDVLEQVDDAVRDYLEDNPPEVPGVDLSNYYTKQVIDTKFSGYYTKRQVDEQISSIPSGGNVDLSNYYNKTESNNRYYTKSQVDSKLSGYYNKEQIDDAFANIDVSGVDMSRFATKAMLESALGEYIDDVGALIGGGA